MTKVPEVLFVCVHNAGRSQMAAALLDHHAHGRVHVRSAGSAPMFIVLEVAGALAAVLVARFWHPTLRSADLVIPEPT